MKKSDIKTDGTLTVVVYNDNILGVLYPNDDGLVWLDYIKTSILRGGPDKHDGPEVIGDECISRCRLATKADFDKFRVAYTKAWAEIVR